MLAEAPLSLMRPVSSSAARGGSSTFGICSNPFLDEEFRTIAYEASITFHSPQSFSYRENTQMQIKGQSGIFHHVDLNTLEKTK